MYNENNPFLVNNTYQLFHKKGLWKTAYKKGLIKNMT